MDRRTEWIPFDEDDTETQIAGVAAAIGAPPKRVLDLGCGDGRTMIPLLRRGYDVCGVDRDPQAIAACRARARDAGLRIDDHDLKIADFFDPVEIHEPIWDCVLLLGNTLMTVVSRRDLTRMFESAFSACAPIGMLVVDDFPFSCWREIAEGRWQEGMSDDGSLQLLWQPGEAIFALRRGSEADPDDWLIRESDRLCRVWSWSDLCEVARACGFAAADCDRAHQILVFRKGQ